MDFNYEDLAFPGQASNEKVRELRASYAAKRTSDAPTPDTENTRKRDMLSLLASLFV